MIDVPEICVWANNYFIVLDLFLIEWLHYTDIRRFAHGCVQVFNVFCVYIFFLCSPSFSLCLQKSHGAKCQDVYRNKFFEAKWITDMAFSFICQIKEKNRQSEGVWKLIKRTRWSWPFLDYFINLGRRALYEI